MRRFWELFTSGVFGAMCYGGIEVAERGYSHISMGVLGAAAMMVIHELNGERRKGRIDIFSAVMISVLFITSGELLAGEILNRRMGMKIWNYRGIPLNFDGQICLMYSVVWLFLSLFGIAADELIRRFIFREVPASDGRSHL